MCIAGVLISHVANASSRAGGRGDCVAGFSPETDTSAIDLPSLREMSPAEVGTVHVCASNVAKVS